MPHHKVPTTTFRSVFALFRSFACRIGLHIFTPTPSQHSGMPTDVFFCVPALQATPYTSKPWSAQDICQDTAFFQQSDTCCDPDLFRINLLCKIHDFLRHGYVCSNSHTLLQLQRLLLCGSRLHCSIP